MEKSGGRKSRATVPLRRGCLSHSKLSLNKRLSVLCTFYPKFLFIPRGSVFMWEVVSPQNDPNVFFHSRAWGWLRGALTIRPPTNQPHDILTTLPAHPIILPWQYVPMIFLHRFNPPGHFLFFVHPWFVMDLLSHIHSLLRALWHDVQPAVKRNVHTLAKIFGHIYDVQSALKQDVDVFVTSHLVTPEGL